MEGCCGKYNNTREEMLKMKYEFRTEQKEALQAIRLFGLLKYKHVGMAS